MSLGSHGKQMKTFSIFILAKLKVNTNFQEWKLICAYGIPRKKKNVEEVNKRELFLKQKVWYLSSASS